MESAIVSKSKNQFPKAYFGKIFLSYLAVAIVGAVCIVLWLIDSEYEQQRENVSNELQSQAVLLGEAIAKKGVGSIDSLMAELSKVANNHVTILDGRAKFLARSQYSPSQFKDGNLIAKVLHASPKGFGEQPHPTLNKNVFYFIDTVYDDALLTYIYVEKTKNIAQYDLSIIKKMVIFLCAFFSFLALLFVLFVMKRAAKEINFLSDQANIIAQGDYSQRVRSNYPQQTVSLTSAINSVAENSEKRIHQISLERNQLSVILSSLVEGVVALDAHQTVLHINEAAGQLLNITPNYLVGKSFLSVVRHPNIQSVIDSAFANKHEAKGQLELNFLDSNKIIDLHAVTFSMPQTQSQGVILVLHDVSMRKQLENVRRDFVANASHELKTPITAIKGLIETIRDDDDMPSAIRQRFTDKIYYQAQRLSDLTVQLMDLSRIESDVEELTLDTFNLIVLCRQLVEHYTHDLSEHLSIVFNEGDEDVIVSAHRKDIERLVSNLLDNAIKYSSQGVIFLRVWREGGNAMIQIEDSGVGISELDMQRVFERFYRADKAHSSEIQGNGLGLSIVKNIVENNAGTITVSSELGKGSCFTVALPGLHKV